MQDFAGKTAVVTGAASGIGRALATRFAAEGMRVVLADIEREPLERAARIIADGAETLAVPTDVSKFDDMEALARQAVDRFGSVDVLCLNAGVAGGGLLWEATQADWDWVMGVNLWGVIHGVRAFVPVMLAQDSEGHIVSTASMAGLMAAGGIYGITKHAVVALSEALHRDLRQVGSKIGVSVLCPGFVSTNIMDSARNRPADLAAEERPLTPEMEEARKFVLNAIASGMPPEQVADVVFNAIRDERFYILPHPEFKEAISQRFDWIINEKTPQPQFELFRRSRG